MCSSLDATGEYPTEARDEWHRDKVGDVWIVPEIGIVAAFVGVHALACFSKPEAATSANAR